jgi:predicted  nucleic acid-binding Zn-ribbon protein
MSTTSIEQRLYILENEFKKKGQTFLNEIKNQKSKIENLQLLVIKQSKQIHQLEHELSFIKYIIENENDECSHDEEDFFNGPVNKTDECVWKNLVNKTNKS